MSSESRVINKHNIDEVASWCGGRVVVQHDALDSSITFPAINVPVGDNVRRANIGDMVIKKDDGSFEIFTL